jgi:hypothetical protein
MKVHWCAGTGAAGCLRAGALASLLLVLVLAGCDQFSTEGVANRCVRSAMKAGEPYGNDVERHRAEEQFREYCRKAAEGS